MHNSYFFLKRIAQTLHKKISGFEFVEIFSQHKGELILGLANSNQSFYIKANLDPQFSCLSFPKEFSRAKKNSVDLFWELIGRPIDAVTVAENDRALKIHTQNFTLLFKMYGNRSNIILFNQVSVQELFKQKLEKDYHLKLKEDFDKKIDLSYEKFIQCLDNLNKFIPTLSKADLSNILEDNIIPGQEKESYKLLMSKLQEIENGPVYINYEFSPPRLLLYQSGENFVSYTDPLEAVNQFYLDYSKKHLIEKTKQALLKEKQRELKKIENYILTIAKKKKELVEGESYRQIADILMANLHAVQKGSRQVDLYDFYNDRTISIPLKKDISPQKNAENFYRKAKNQKIEVNKLKANLEEKELRRMKLIEQIKAIEEENNYKNLTRFDSIKINTPTENLPYNSLTIEGFQILVGKNAKSNDLLTFKVADKNDLWLHAKDTTGSHVIIRQIAGKNVSKQVLQKAAAIAAWFSKRKTEGLVPVSFTERKYVRKTKDLLPGQVIVQKENTLLAEPYNWLSKN